MSPFKHINTKTKRLLFLMVGINVIAILLYGALFYVVEKERSGGQEVLARVEEALLVREEAQSLKHLMVDTQSARDQLDSYFVNSEDVVSFIEEMESLGSRAGVSLDLSSVSVDKEANSLFLQFNTRGSWGQTAYFLALLETFPRKIRTERISLNKANAAEEESGLVWQGSFTIVLESFVAI